MFGGEETKACCVSGLVNSLVDSSGLCGWCHPVNGLSTKKVKLEWDTQVEASCVSFSLSWLGFRLWVGFPPHSPASLCTGSTGTGWHPCSAECMCVLSSRIRYMYNISYMCIFYVSIICIYNVCIHTHIYMYIKKPHLANCPKKQKMPRSLPVTNGDFICRMCPSEVLSWRWCPEPCLPLKRRVCTGGIG